MAEHKRTMTFELPILLVKDDRKGINETVSQDQPFAVMPKRELVDTAKCEHGGMANVVASKPKNGQVAIYCSPCRDGGVSTFLGMRDE